MIKNAVGSDRLLNKATHFSAVLLLLCIPFRATVDKRGGRLALVVLLLACKLARRHEWGACLPDSRALRVAGLVWLLSTFMWALFGPTPDESLQILRRDVLSPILGFCVFYALTKTRTDLMRWVLLAFAVQTLVAILAVLDPFQPNVTTHRPAYIEVGVLSAWSVIIAALLPFLWWAPRRLRASYRPLAVVMAISLGAAAFASGNRLIWFCFAVMLLAGTMLPFRVARAGIAQRATNVKPPTPLLMALVAGLLLLAWLSLQLRGPVAGAGPDNSISYVLDDPRKILWNEAFQVIADEPLTGHGFGVPALRAKFVALTTKPNNAPGFEHAHNMVLDYGMQMGIPGMVVIVTLFAALAHAFGSVVLASPTALARLAATCGIALVAGFVLRNMADDFFLRQPALLFAMVAGMLLGAARPRPRSRRNGAVTLR